jgi:hypothetical protein
MGKIEIIEQRIQEKLKDLAAHVDIYELKLLIDEYTTCVKKLAKEAVKCQRTKK